VFKQVRETAAPGRIILRSHPIPHLDGRSRRGVVFEPDELEAIGQRTLLKLHWWNALCGTAEGQKRGEQEGGSESGGAQGEWEGDGESQAWQCGIPAEVRNLDTLENWQTDDGSAFDKAPRAPLHSGLAS